MEIGNVNIYIYTYKWNIFKKVLCNIWVCAWNLKAHRITNQNTPYPTHIFNVILIINTHSL